jgi:6-phosphogluconolactonase
MMFRTLIALAAFVPVALLSQTANSGKTVLYAAAGNQLTQYDLDPANATLTKRASVTLPANVQEAWPNPSHKDLYVAWSNGGASNAPVNGVNPKGDRHGITAFHIDPASGALLIHGKSAPLPSRPIFITTDTDGAHVIAAHNDPSALTVYRILPDGALGEQVQQPASLDFGIYGHQVRADPSGKTVILVTRGNGPAATKPEDPGALKLFSYKDGVLSNLRSIAPNGGFGYQVRHLDFHPSGKWAFVTLERQNQIQVYKRTPDGTLGSAPLFVKSTLPSSAPAGPGQTAASIHFHPSGRFVYVANRSADTAAGNSMSVFSINQDTGEPTLIQTIETHGFEPRTFALDSGGRILAVANQLSKGALPASLALFRIHDDGKLEFARKYDIETSPGKTLFWAGTVSLR